MGDGPTPLRRIDGNSTDPAAGCLTALMLTMVLVWSAIFVAAGLAVVRWLWGAA